MAKSKSSNVQTSKAIAGIEKAITAFESVFPPVPPKGHGGRVDLGAGRTMVYDSVTARKHKAVITALNKIIHRIQDLGMDVKVVDTDPALATKKKAKGRRKRA